MRAYWRYHIWELLLLLLAAFPMALTFAQGFYIPDGTADSIPLAVLVCGVTLGYCYLGGYRWPARVASAVGLVLIAAAFFLWIRGQGISVEDYEGSPTAVYLYWIGVPVLSVAAFLLSRTRLGIGAMFLAGSCLYAVNDFLGFEVQVWWLMVFLAAVLALYLLRTGRIDQDGRTAARPAVGRIAGHSAATAVLALALACGAFFAIVRPLDPPTADLKLLTRYLSYDVLERVGIARQYPIPEDLLQEEQEQSPTPFQQPEEDPQETQTPATVTPPPDNGNSDVDDREELSSVSYDPKATPYLLAGLVCLVLVLAAVPCLRRWRRRQVMARLRRGDGREQMIALYQFYLKKLQRLGCPRRPSQTAEEYASAYDAQLGAYTEGGMGLKELTEHYVAARYGRAQPEPQVCDACAGLYPVLLRNYRRQHGTIRYLLHYFTL